jgi:hypothetical protein
MGRFRGTVLACFRRHAVMPTWFSAETPYGTAGPTRNSPASRAGGSGPGFVEVRTSTVSCRHQSAAVLLGMPLWGVRLDQVHVTRRPPASTSTSGPLRVHVSRLRDDELTAVGGITVTDVGRTALDLARSLPFEPGVAALDAVLNEGLITRELLERRLFDIAGTRGSRHAARVIRFADGRSGSVGESRSRVALHELGLAPSSLQHEIRTSDGRLVGLADFAWEAEHVVGEFDGRIKYGRLLRPGQEPGDAVFEEKRREDANRDEGWEVVRWIWADLAVRDGIGERVRRAQERGARRRR